jgi:hypothetical protein
MFRLSHLHADYASTKRLVSVLTKLIEGSLAQQIPMTLDASHLVKCVHGLHRLDRTDPSTKALVDVFGRLVGSMLVSDQSGKMVFVESERFIQVLQDLKHLDYQETGSQGLMKVVLEIAWRSLKGNFRSSFLKSLSVKDKDWLCDEMSRIASRSVVCRDVSNLVIEALSTSD